MKICPDCKSQMPDEALACPVCGSLVYREELEKISAQAAELEKSGKLSEAREAWRNALAYLPFSTRQYKIVNDKIAGLNEKLPAAESKPGSQEKGPAAGKIGIFVAFGLLIWKFKFILAFILTKGKILLLGLTKASTFFSLFLSLGVYWSLFGWKLAAGFLLCIYVHEMGHVFALSRLGIKASAPMFVPGFGAYVRMHEHPASAVEDARVGLAGPIWGLAATCICFLLFLLTEQQIFAALTRLSAWVNLFNLLPVWQLDGNRGFSALGRMHRLYIAASVAVAFVLTHEGLLVLLLLMMVYRAFGRDVPAKSDNQTLYYFVFLVLGLALLSAIEVPAAVRSTEARPLASVVY